MKDKATGDELATREQGALMRASWARFMSWAQRVRWGLWAALLVSVAIWALDVASWWNAPDGGGLLALLQLGRSTLDLRGQLREVFGKGSAGDRRQALLSHDGAACCPESVHEACARPSAAPPAARQTLQNPTPPREG